MNFEINLAQLPQVKFSDLDQLPNCSGIYFAHDSEGIIHYIGKAEDLQKRWKTHHRKAQLESINEKYPIKIAWLVWSKDDLTSAESYFINNYKPLLNNTKVENPELIPSEVILKQLLRKIANKICAVGIVKATNNQLTTVYLKYDATNITAKGVAAIIRQFKAENKDKSLKIKWQKYKYSIPFDYIYDGNLVRPGSRIQKKQARERRAFNNHWQIACNGVIIDITPENGLYALEFFKTKSIPWRLANIKTRAIVEPNFTEMINHPHYRYIIENLDLVSPLNDLISPIEIDKDPIPLLWRDWKN
jgi:hypothetical protein